MPAGLDQHQQAERVLIALTSNKHVRDWPEIFVGDEILITAILDRLLHHVHIIHIEGRSYPAMRTRRAPSEPGHSRVRGRAELKQSA